MPIRPAIQKPRPKQVFPKRAGAHARSKRPRILVVCQGNTCRSPMAEAIARKLLGATSQLRSAGLDAAEGLPATRHAVTVMEEMGLDIRSHRSRGMESVGLRSFDLFIAMTPEIAAALLDAGADARKIVTLDVPDPYSGGLDVYRSTAQNIASQLESICGSPEQNAV